VVHISHYTTVRGPDILCNVIVWAYVTFYQINKFFVRIFFFNIGKTPLQQVEMVLRAEFGPRAVVWRPCSIVTPLVERSLHKVVWLSYSLSSGTLFTFTVSR